MKKIILILGIISLLLVSGCQLAPPVISKPQLDYNQCGQHGYVSNHDVNGLINISNRLIIINNICTQNSNLTPIPNIEYLPEN